MSIVDDRHDVVGESAAGIVIARSAVAMAGEIRGHDAVLTGQEGGDERPPLGVGRAAVNQHEPRFPRVAPGQVMNRRATDIDRVVLARRSQGVGKPARCVGHSLEVVPESRSSRESAFGREERSTVGTPAVLV